MWSDLTVPWARPPCVWLPRWPCCPTSRRPADGTSPRRPWIGLHGDHLDVSVAVPADANRPQRVGVKGRRLLLPRGHLTELDGCPVTTPARTWLDCAPLVPLEHLVAMGDATLRRHLTTAAELAEVTRWAHGRRGVVKARRALPILDGRSESPGESLVRAHLVLGGTEPPECNVDIVVAGEWIARADLAWRRHRLIVEYDGSVHLTDRNRKGDAARRNLLMQAGWRVLTFTSADLAHPWTMVALVRSELRRPIHPSER
jgi:hypothetical protein